MRSENRRLAEGSADAVPGGINSFVYPANARSKSPGFVSASTDGKFLFFAFSVSINFVGLFADPLHEQLSIVLLLCIQSFSFSNLSYFESTS